MAVVSSTSGPPPSYQMSPFSTISVDDSQAEFRYLDTPTRIQQFGPSLAPSPDLSVQSRQTPEPMPRYISSYAPSLQMGLPSPAVSSIAESDPSVIFVPNSETSSRFAPSPPPSFQLGPASPVSTTTDLQPYNPYEYATQNYEQLRNEILDLQRELDQTKQQLQQVTAELEQKNYASTQAEFTHMLKVDELESSLRKLINQLEDKIVMQDQNLSSAREELATLQLDYDMLQADYQSQRNDGTSTINERQQLIAFLKEQFEIPSEVSAIQDVIQEAGNKANLIRQKLQEQERMLRMLTSDVSELQSSSIAKEEYLLQLIENINKRLTAELELIDTEIAMYNQSDDNFKMNPLVQTDFSPVRSHELNPNIPQEFLPFLSVASGLLVQQNDFPPNFLENPDAVYIYHAYMIFISKLFNIYSPVYVRSYIQTLVEKCRRAMQAQEQYISLPGLVLPQTFTTNSLHFLMNRYNSKVYEPDRVFDFSEFLYNFLKPEFQADKTKALNLFQSGIGKRYNSIFIYSQDTMKRLKDLRDSLASLKV